MSLNVQSVRKKLEAFDFKGLLVEELGWSNPARRNAETLNEGGAAFELTHLAQLSGVAVVEIKSLESIPEEKIRAALQRKVAEQHHENIAVFTNRDRTQSLWRWVKRENGKQFHRDHYFVKGQPGDLFISKIGGMFFDISEMDRGVSLVDVSARIRKALDVKQVTHDFYEFFKVERIAFTKLIQGIGDERDLRWYASVLLNRLMFVYFLQAKGLIDNGKRNYLRANLDEAPLAYGHDSYYREFLRPLFFQGFALPADKRDPELAGRLGTVPYLNGSLFLLHPIEARWKEIQIPDEAFVNLYALFEKYSWNLDDSPGGKDDEISPDVLGYIFEKFINQKAFGAYYTRPEITEYLCEQTIHRLILDKINPPEGTNVPGLRRFESMGDLILNLDANLCRNLIRNILPKLSLLDPACGSGAFLVAAMKTLVNLYGACLGWIETNNDRELRNWLDERRGVHKSLQYYIKREIIVNNLYGVDIMEEATEIARLRLFLALVSSARTVEELEPLPNIDFNILPGNSLIGMLDVKSKKFEEKQKIQLALFDASHTYNELLEEKNRLVTTYRKTTGFRMDITAMRDEIETKKAEARKTLNSLLLDDFITAGAKYEESTWDDAKRQEGKPKKRPLVVKDIETLRPFHWGYEFDQILQERGGFDAIIANPPWEIVKPNAKEFFMEHSDLVTKNKMTIKEFEDQQEELLAKAEIRTAWLSYLSEFPHLSSFYRAAPQYKNQISVVNGKKAGTDINLYKLFLEQCFNLLRPGGQCGIVVPSGLYTDLGTKQLREMLFGQAQVTGLFCFENRKGIFEGVDSRFKFIVLTFGKGGVTKSFPAAFMRHEVAELRDFPRRGGLEISVELVRRLSPDSLSVMEFKSDIDVRIAEKMLKFPLLGEKIEGTWNLVLSNEFHMTNDSRLFKTSPGAGRLPLFTGKMFHQFEMTSEKSGYWLEETEGRKALIGKKIDIGQPLDYQRYRWVHRRIASNTNERTLIVTMSPKKVFTEVNSTTLKVKESNILDSEMLFLCAISNSFVVDSILRQKVTTTLNMFYIYQLPVPRLTEKDAWFKPIVERAARLICTTSEFDDLAKEAGLRDHSEGVTNPIERRKLRAELDGIIAHLYGLTEAEFAHILTTFPLVPEPVKVATHNAYRDVERGLIR